MRILLEDMSRFALRNCYIVDKVPMQIYMSSLLFAPADSNTRQMFGHNLQRYFGLMPHIPGNWGTERQKLEGHYGNVTTAAFSPAGRIIVSGSTDNTIRLWDTVTGKERQKLDGHDCHKTLATQPAQQEPCRGQADHHHDEYVPGGPDVAFVKLEC